MKQILSLKKTQNEESKLPENKLLFNQLPFYGVGGTIHHFEEQDNSYYKVLYNQDGTINPQKLPIPKKKGKNYKLITEEYYKEVEKYLTSLKNQYLEYENNEYKPTLTNNQFYILIISTFLASIAAIPFFLTTAYIGLIFETISLLSLYIVCDVHKKDITNNKNHNEFKKQYKKFHRDLTNYKSGDTNSKEKILETTFTKIEEVDKSRSITYPNVKSLTKEGKEAA